MGITNVKPRRIQQSTPRDFVLRPRADFSRSFNNVARWFLWFPHKQGSRVNTFTVQLPSASIEVLQWHQIRITHLLNIYNVADTIPSASYDLIYVIHIIILWLTYCYGAHFTNEVTETWSWILCLKLIQLGRGGIRISTQAAWFINQALYHHIYTAWKNNRKHKKSNLSQVTTISCLGKWNKLLTGFLASALVCYFHWFTT